MWELNEHSNLHHVGIWSDDLRGDSTGLAGAGLPPAARAAATATTRRSSFAYHRDDELGVRFELVDATMRDAMAFLFEPDPGPA